MSKEKFPHLFLRGTIWEEELINHAGIFETAHSNDSSAELCVILLYLQNAS